ncbi:hypothetical protein Q1695_015618 [Nippostrongylus brasiliensis]|nr:hypothetical protein Q1695_015618 [Nippostrongylus brasiliensis]
MLRPIYVTLCFVVLLGDAVPEISHLHQKLAELKKKHGLEGVGETHKMDYPYRHQAIKFADIMPILSDYAAVHRERSAVIAHHPVHGPLHEFPLSKISLSDVMNRHGGVANLRSGR